MLNSCQIKNIWFKQEAKTFPGYDHMMQALHDQLLLKHKPERKITGFVSLLLQSWVKITDPMLSLQTTKQYFIIAL